MRPAVSSRRRGRWRRVRSWSRPGGARGRCGSRPPGRPATHRAKPRADRERLWWSCPPDVIALSTARQLLPSELVGPGDGLGQRPVVRRAVQRALQQRRAVPVAGGARAARSARAPRPPASPPAATSPRPSPRRARSPRASTRRRTLASTRTASEPTGAFAAVSARSEAAIAPPSDRDRRSLPASVPARQPSRVANHPSSRVPSMPSAAPLPDACTSVRPRHRARRGDAAAARRTCVHTSPARERGESTRGPPPRGDPSRPERGPSRRRGRGPPATPARRPARCARRRGRGARTPDRRRGRRPSQTSVVGTSVAQIAATQLGRRAHMAPRAKSVTRSEHASGPPLPGAHTAVVVASRRSAPPGSSPTTMALAGMPSSTSSTTGSQLARPEPAKSRRRRRGSSCRRGRGASPPGQAAPTTARAAPPRPARARRGSLGASRGSAAVTASSSVARRARAGRPPARDPTSHPRTSAAAGFPLRSRRRAHGPRRPTAPPPRRVA